MFGLYFLQAYVSKLILNKNAYKDSGGSTLAVRIDFIRFPSVEVFEHKRLNIDETYFFEFQGGQGRHFSMKPEELANKMKKTPIRIGVYRAGDTFPICETCTPLSGCACDLASVSTEESLPFVFKGPFDLVDPGNNPSGELAADIAIVNMGRCVVTRYALAQARFIFKNEQEETEYECSYKDGLSAESPGGGYRSFISGDNLANTGDRAIKLDSILAENLIRDIAGISPAAERLAVGSPPPKPPRIPLPDSSTLLGKSRKRPRKRKGRKGKKKRA